MASGDHDDEPFDLRVSDFAHDGVELVVVGYRIEAEDPSDDDRLTPAEAEVAKMAMRGASNPEIAAARGTSVRTVANQMASILAKLQLHSRHQLSIAYVRGARTRSE